MTRPYVAPAFVLLLTVFLAVAVRSPDVQMADLVLSNCVQGMRSGPLDAAARALTWLGDGTVIVVFAAGAALSLAVRRRPVAALFCFVPLLSTPLNWLLKEMAGRPRPSEGLVDVIVPAEGLSFPSGHAMGAAMFYGLAAYLLWLHLRDPRFRAAAVLLAALAILLVGWSRVYLGVHWPSDVLGGWAAGLAFAELLALLYRAIGGPEIGRQGPG